MSRWLYVPCTQQAVVLQCCRAPCPDGDLSTKGESYGVREKERKIGGRMELASSAQHLHVAACLAQGRLCPLDAGNHPYHLTHAEGRLCPVEPGNHPYHSTLAKGRLCPLELGHCTLEGLHPWPARVQYSIDLTPYTPRGSTLKKGACLRNYGVIPFLDPSLPPKSQGCNTDVRL